MKKMSSSRGRFGNGCKTGSDNHQRRQSTKVKLAPRWGKKDVSLFSFSTAEDMPRRQQKAITRYDPSSQPNYYNQRAANSVVGEGFDCPECSYECSYDSRVCNNCKLECCYEPGVGVVVLQERLDSKIRRSEDSTNIKVSKKRSHDNRDMVGNNRRQRRDSRSIANSQVKTEPSTNEAVHQQTHENNEDESYDNDMITFDSIVGLNDVKEAVYRMVIDPIHRPNLYTGLRAPSNLLLFGPTGTGE